MFCLFTIATRTGKLSTKAKQSHLDARQKYENR